jgi:hypothetical protein
MRIEMLRLNNNPKGNGSYADPYIPGMITVEYFFVI